LFVAGNVAGMIFLYMGHDVFISHSSKDKTAADALRATSSQAKTGPH